MNIDDHSWSSFDSKKDGVPIPRWQPSHCTLRLLFDRIAQDFFPRRKVSLDTQTSHLHSEIRLKFHELDEHSTIMSTTEIQLHNQKPKNAVFLAMNINQQLEALEGWLKTCNKNLGVDPNDVHKQCQRDNDLTIPAKRVLNLEQAAAGTVNLVESTDCKGRYVALSHCWGDPLRHPPSSTHGTLQDHMSGIAVSSLPQSFRDAIRVSLHLGVSYLWIDCLCIVQDDRYGYRSVKGSKADSRLVLSG